MQLAEQTACAIVRFLGAQLVHRVREPSLQPRPGPTDGAARTGVAEGVRGRPERCQLGLELEADAKRIRARGQGAATLGKGTPSQPHRFLSDRSRTPSISPP
jgi:hypothetical protein